MVPVIFLYSIPNDVDSLFLNEASYLPETSTILFVRALPVMGWSRAATVPLQYFEHP